MTIIQDTAGTAGAITTGVAVESGGGFTWSSILGTWSKSAGKFVQSEGWANGLITTDAATADVDITATVSNYGGEAIYFRATNATNWLRAKLEIYYYRVLKYDGSEYLYHRDYKVVLEQMVAGTVTRLGDYKWANDAFSGWRSETDKTLKVRAFKSSIKVFLDGVQVITTSTNQFQTITKHGVGRSADYSGGSIGTVSPSVARLDNFYLKTLETPVPSIGFPSPYGTVTTAVPIAQVALDSSLGEDQKIQFQYATNVGFTTGLITVTQPDADFKISGNQNIYLPGGTTLAQGTWFARARAVNRFGDYSPWTAVNQFTVAHAPSVGSLTPTGSKAVIYDGLVRHSWVFGDTYSGDSQKAYRVVIERNDTGVQVYDSTKITATASFRDIDVSAYLDLTLRFKVMVWDQEDVASPWSDYALYIPSNDAVFAITAPVNGSTTTNSSPQVDWTFTGPSGRQQKNFRVVYYDNTDSVIAHDSGLITSSVLRLYKPAYSVLKNDHSYSISLTGTDNLDLPIFASSVTITVHYTTPPPGVVSVDPTRYDDLGYMRVWWDMAPSETFISWRIYRRKVGGDWVMIADILDPNTQEFRDYLAPSQEEYEYSVVQVVYLFGENVESQLSDPISGIAPNGGYWLIDGIDNSLSVRLYGVTGESFKGNHEQAELAVVGRGRHIDKGENLGRTGTLSIQVRTDATYSARQKRQMIETMIDNVGPIYLRNPFGDVMQVSLGDPDNTRLVAGPAELIDMSLPYSEVF